MARRITPEVADCCRMLDLSFIDTVVHAYLDAPGLFVFITGQHDCPDDLLRVDTAPCAGTAAAL